MKLILKVSPITTLKKNIVDKINYNKTYSKKYNDMYKYLIFLQNIICPICYKNKFSL